MKIAKLYNQTTNTNNKIEKCIYKFNKLLIHLLYPFSPVAKQGINDNSDIIVSLTSFNQRINSVQLTIKSLLNQTIKPKKIILWLAKEEFPNEDGDLPSKLKKLKNNGLTIKYCDNLRSHKKYYYTMLEFPENTIVTTDDDVIYPEDMLERLIMMSQKHPNCVICNFANKFVLDDNMDIYSYDKWNNTYDIDKESISIIPIGMGGVLYPKAALNKELFNINAIRYNCFSADDLWLKAMQILNKTKAVLSCSSSFPFYTIVGTKKTGLYHMNIEDNKSKEAWEKIMNSYPECRKILIKMVEEENNGKYY